MSSGQVSCQVGPGTHVTLRYDLYDEEDALIESSDVIGELEAIVGFGQLSRAIELALDGVTIERKEFPAEYPPTVGETWDYSLVRFRLGDPADGAPTALVTAIDAAGNRTEVAVDLTIDGTPPTVSLAGPAEDVPQAGWFVVEIELLDPGGGPVWADLSADGVVLASASGPTATITLDAADFAPGPLTLTATAYDQAGNAAAVGLTVTIAE